MRIALSALLLACTAMPPAFAQQAQADPEAPAQAEGEVDDDGTIIVTGKRLRGAVVGDIPPEESLDREDVAATGASDIGELLDALAPRTQSARGRGGGRPIVLLNGRRISSFRELRDLPAEAVERVDILPEEVALKYGYAADRRVVNIVLVENFRSFSSEADHGFATGGGRSGQEAGLGFLHIAGGGRTSVQIEYEQQSLLLESERDIERPGDGGEIAPDQRPFRSLLPESQRFEASATVNRTIFGDIDATLTASFDLAASQALNGLPSASLIVPPGSPFARSENAETILRHLAALAPLASESESQTGHAGLGLNGRIAPWMWSFTANYDLATSIARTDRAPDPGLVQARIDAGDPALDPFGALPAELVRATAPDIARSRTEKLGGELVAIGELIDLPAGALSTTARLGFELLDFASESSRGGSKRIADLARDRLGAQLNLDLPVSAADEDVLAALGDLSLNANAAVQRLSDFGTLVTWGAGLVWSPSERLALIASLTEEEGAPTIEQLGAPAIVTPNVPTFDFAAGETVEVTRIDGGNPALVADERLVYKLGANWRPLSGADLRLAADYTASRIDDPIAAFPVLTPEIEAAFPERFVRDAGGNLVEIDNRPVNFAGSETSQLRWGATFSGSLGGEEEGGGRRGPRFGPGGGGGRYRLSLFHTWRLAESILVREGVPELDLLGGAAAGNSGGRPRHQVDFQAGIFKHGLGGRLDAAWQSGTFVRGGLEPASGAGDLFFSDLMRVELRLFANLGEREALVGKIPWLENVRLFLVAANLFDDRIAVRDALGETPLSFQPGYLDPLGRSLRIGLRKLFF
ncbi:MAG: TonB-dependent receptor [Sphingomonadaceae bacterium]